MIYVNIDVTANAIMDILLTILPLAIITNIKAYKNNAETIQRIGYFFFTCKNRSTARSNAPKISPYLISLEEITCIYPIKYVI